MAARGRKRKSRRVSDGGDDKNGAAASPEHEGAGYDPSAEECPACEDGKEVKDKETWVQCDNCKKWYHWFCTASSEELELAAIDKWFCQPCRDANPARQITLKPPARKSARQRTQQRDYATLNEGLANNPEKWVQWLEERKVAPDNFKRMEGKDVGREWLAQDDDAMTEPIVIEEPEGLGLKMPVEGFTVDDVVRLMGDDHPVEVIDVATQSTSPGWTLSKWAQYFNTPAEKRDKIRNVISLEISNSKLADLILPPRLVRELDWVEKYWPTAKKGKAQVYPKVQLYCLMGVHNAWTDWHIDFAGSSVYYHIYEGEKVFYFVRPTPENLAAYEKWSGSDAQSTTWFGDLVDEVIKVQLEEGNTMIIPSGWIHAVYTPTDALVFGGNFLHSHSIKTQLRVREIELATGVPKKFQFPLFPKLCWYVGEKYLRDIRAKEEFSTRILDGLQALADFLVSQARLIERGADPARREAKEAVPTDRIKDAPAVARELRWRVRLALDAPSDDEGAKKMNGHGGGAKAAHVTKRKRETSAGADGAEPRNFRNFKPKAWDEERREPRESEKKVVQVGKSEDVPMGDLVATDGAGPVVSEGGEEGEYESRGETIVRARRVNADGRVVIEKQTVKRLLETWTLAH
ncbi:Clavaminate synthase-like protein [Auricularia subglabra TFB-10046 SS5]|nr:Clavaminate synthase-like protein [Auricularia subglabra TFB-10046 SS5]